MAKKARDIMTGSPECAGEKDSIIDVSKKLAKLDVGAMPICGEDDRLKGMITDRDIAVRVLAEDRDPRSTTAGDLAQGKPVTIGADDGIDEVIRTMSEYKVRRLPVIDGRKLIGIISQADVANNVDEEEVGKLVDIISD